MTTQHFPTAPTMLPGGDVPRSAPLYGATPVEAVQRFFTKYAVFTGRASRSEFWWWYLTHLVVMITLVAIGSSIGSIGSVAGPDGTHPGPFSWVPGALFGAWWLATLVPLVSLAFRRLHDANMRAWWLLLVLLGLGPFVLIALASRSKPEGARFDRPRV